MPPLDPRRILVVSLDNLGDLVLASALVPPLRDAFPSATIDVWCKTYTAPIAALIPGVNAVVASDPFWAVHPQHARPPVLPFLKSVLRVRRSRYDVAILSEAPWRAAAAVAACGIPTRIGRVRRKNARFLTHVLPPSSGAPVVTEQAALLEPLGIPITERRCALDASSLEPVRRELAPMLPPRFAAVHPFAAVPEKRASLELWFAVSDDLELKGLPVVWIGTPAELDELRRLRPEARRLDRLRDASLTTTAAALASASLFVGHDSGPMHIANALGVPVVAVFVTGRPERYGPWGTGPSRTVFAQVADQLRADDIIRETDALLFSSVT